MDSYSYEPLRLIRDGHGGIVENCRAALRFKQAGAAHHFCECRIACSREKDRKSAEDCNGSL